MINLYIDLRTTGKKGEEFYEQAQRAGVDFLHGRGTEVISCQRELLVKTEDTLLGRQVMVPVDMVVLAVGMEPHPDAGRIARLFGIGCGAEGFFTDRHLKFSPVQTAVDGVFIAGACQGPKDIPESITQGAAAAAGALLLHRPGGGRHRADRGPGRRAPLQRLPGLRRRLPVPGDPDRHRGGAPRGARQRGAVFQ